MACCLTFVPLAGIELVLRTFFEKEKRTELNDPFVVFQDSPELFELDEAADRYRIRPERLDYFQPASFSVTKQPNEFRIFVLGGSTVQGRPYEPATAFPKWLELNLDASDPETRWNVINCGGVSYASYRLRPILDEVLEYEPDLVILCTGHNEFLEERTFESIKQAHPWVVGAHNWLSNLETYRRIRNWTVREEVAQAKKFDIHDELQTRLDFEDGLSLFKDDPAHDKFVETQFEINLRAMVQSCQLSDVALLLVAPPSNLSIAPLKPGRIGNPPNGKNATPMSSEELFSAGISEPDPKESAMLLTAARDLDLCPLRMTSNLKGVIERVAAEYEKDWIDTDRVFDESVNSEDFSSQRAGLFLDHVHPTITGHKIISSSILEWMIDRDFLSPADDFAVEFESRSKAHLKTLDFGYFQRGNDRLKSIKLWASGKAIRAIPRAANGTQ